MVAMLSIDTQGKVHHLNPHMPTEVKVPHRRDVLNALKEIHRHCEGLQVSGDVDVHINTVCNFLGITLEQLLHGEEQDPKG